MSFSLRWVGRGGLCRTKQVFSGVLKEMVHKLWRVCVRRSILPLLSTETCLWSTLLTCCCTTACMTRPMSCCNRPYGSTAQRYNGDRWTPHISSSKPVWMSLFCWTQRKIYWRMWETEQFWGTIDFHSIFFPTIEVNGAPKQPGYKLSSKYLPLCSAEQINSYRFGNTWRWVNDDRMFIFGRTIPLISLFILQSRSYILSIAYKTAS